MSDPETFLEIPKFRPTAFFRFLELVPDKIFQGRRIDQVHPTRGPDWN